jgi:hypothetical protein
MAERRTARQRDEAHSSDMENLNTRRMPWGTGRRIRATVPLWCPCGHVAEDDMDGRDVPECDRCRAERKEAEAARDWWCG